MIEKNMKSRHVQKHATESEWLKANIFIPKQAEIIVYDVDENHPYERFKIGDGVTLLGNLPFSNEMIDLAGYATEEYVDDAIANVSAGGSIDLSNYATKKDINGYSVIYDENYINTIVINSGDGDFNTVRLISGSLYDFTKNCIKMEGAGSTDNLNLQAENGYGRAQLSIDAVNQDLTFYHSTEHEGPFQSKKVAFTDDIPKIIPLTQSEYDTLPVKDETTIYIIKE